MYIFAQKPKAGQQATSAKTTLPAQAQFGQSHEMNSILYLQRTIGNQAVKRVLETTTGDLEGDSATKLARFGHDFDRTPPNSAMPLKIQAKMSTSTPGDVCEQEADRIADQVMATPASTEVSGASPHIHRFSGQSNGHMYVAPASVEQLLASPGRPLEPALRQDMERRFGHDFSQVRVHSGAIAEQSAREVNAAAYTVGRHVVFGSGKYAPHTPDGKRLLAHELAHTLQQGNAVVGKLARAPMTLAEIDEAIAASGVLLRETERNARTILDNHGRAIQGSLLREGLEDIVGDGRLSAASRDAAQQVLEELDQVDRVLDELWRQRESVAPTRYSAPKQGATPHESKPSTTKAPPKTKSTHLARDLPKTPPARTAGGEVTLPQRGTVTPAGGGANKSVTTASGEVTVPQPKPVPKPSSSLRAGIKGAFSAPSLASMIPDVILAVADRVAAREAIKTIQVKFMKEGFAKGVAAGVMRWSEEEVRLNLKNRITGPRIQGMGDPAGFLQLGYIFQLAEAYENYGVDVGYQFGSSKPIEWKNHMRAKGFAVLAQYGYYFGEDPQALFEYGLVDKLAWVLRSTTNPIAEEGIRFR